MARDVYSVAHDAYGLGYNIKAAQILGSVNLSDELTVDQSSLKRSLLRAAELSAQVYRPLRDHSNDTVSDGHPLSFGVDNQPDCLVHHDTEAEDTIWVAIRGSHTGEDVIHDASWCLQTLSLGDLEVPLGVVQRCQTIYSTFRLYLEQLPEPAKKKVKKINFVGHSLGGAIATGMYIAWSNDPSTASRCNEFLSKDVKVEAYTFGSPLLLSNPPAKFTLNPFTKKDAHPLANNVHNVVLQLDLVPRLLGGHPLPTYLTQSKIGATVQSLMTRGVHRETYRPFGRYYSLREPNHSGMEHLFLRGQESHATAYSNRIQPSLGQVNDPVAFLRLFPDNLADFAFGLTRDHSMERTLTAMKASISLD